MRNNMQKSVIFLSIIVVAIVLTVSIYHYYTATTMLPTYFKYSQAETQALTGLKSDDEMTQNALKKWDDILFKLIKDHFVGDAPASRIYAYVYTAQRDAAYLSYNINHNFVGSLDPVSAEVLCLFFSDSCSNLKAGLKSDAYSEALATLVINKVKQRMAFDKNTKPYPEIVDAQHWAGVRPYYSQDTGAWKTWFLTSSKEFVAPSPRTDSAFWQEQLNMTKQALLHITPEQTKTVVFWAGDPGTITPPGIWLMMANDYMWLQHTPFTKVLLVRSVLSMGIADSVIAVFNSKYTYWVRRAFMMDHSIHTVMPTPNHPSYPAGHSTISGAAATILDYYFPENATAWGRSMEEASRSRVLGGIHFTVDTEQGVILGEKVGLNAIRAQSGS
jgi:hypothetical protein